jgi:hypothetical protein
LSKRISELPVASALDGTEKVEITQDEESVQTTTQAIADLGTGSGGGITNSGDVNEIVKSDGTNVVGASLFSSTDGNLTLGLGSLAGPNRTIGVSSSLPSTNLNLNSAGTDGNVNITAGSGSNGYVQVYSGGGLIVNTSGSEVLIESDGSGSNKIRSDAVGTNHLTIQTEDLTVDNNGSGSLILKTGSAGSGGTGNHNSGNILLDLGSKQGTGKVGNLGVFTTSGSFGSGEKVLFIGNCTTPPSSNPTGGGILYVESGALKYRGSSGTVTPIAPA